MIYGRDLKAGDLVYESHCCDWDHIKEGWRDSFDDWEPNVAIEINGKIYLTSHVTKTKDPNSEWRDVAVLRPNPDRRYGQTPEEAIRLDAALELAYHNERVSFYKEIILECQKRKVT